MIQSVDQSVNIYSSGMKSPSGYQVDGVSRLREGFTGKTEAGQSTDRQSK